MKRAFKIVTAGEGGVGKTTLLHRYIDNKFMEDLQMTLGVQFFKKDLHIDEVDYECIIWDFGGQEQFRTILGSYVPGSSGALFMFELSNVARTLRNMEIWWTILNRSEKIPIILIGTKSDLRDEKNFEMYKGMIDEIQEKYDFIGYIETSSKTGEGVNEAFEILIKEIVERLRVAENAAVID